MEVNSWPGPSSESILAYYVNIVVSSYFLARPFWYFIQHNVATTAIHTNRNNKMKAITAKIIFSLLSKVLSFTVK